MLITINFIMDVIKQKTDVSCLKLCSKKKSFFLIFLFLFFFFLGQQTLKKNSYQIVYVAKGMMTKTEREESKIIVGQSDMSPIWNKI